MALLSRELFKQIRRIEIRTNKLVDSAFSGAYHSAFKGSGIEFEDVREYLPGDDIRSIDWNVTARIGQPYIKNFREERELTVMLVVDLSASTFFGSEEHSRQERLAEIAAVLAFVAIKNHDKVGLILFSDRIEKYLPPQKGSKHVLRIIRELLLLREERRQTNFSVPLEFLGKVQKRHSICFFLSDFLSSLPMDLLSHAAKKHDLIALSLQDRWEATLPKVGLLPLYDFETGEEIVVDTRQRGFIQHMKEQAEQHKSYCSSLFQKLGAVFLSLGIEESYDSALVHLFKQRGNQQ